MKGERIFRAIGGADDDLLSRYETYERRRKRVRLVRWGGLAACLCLIAAGALLLNSGPSDGDGELSESVLEAAPAELEDMEEAEEEEAAEEILDDSDERVHLYGDDMNSASAEDENEYSGANSDHGTWDWSLALEAAFGEAPDGDAVYFLEITIYRDGERLEPDGEEVRAELARLAGQGAQVGLAQTWRYGESGDERVEYSFAAGYFTQEEVISFAAGEYGYYFDFALDGDGEPVEDGFVPAE